jgi:hypothetical protein
MRILISGQLLATLVILTVATASLPAVAAVNNPVMGVYGVSSYVVSATATNGGACGAPQGSYLSSYFYYPGPAKSGAVERHSINGSKGGYIQELDFPATPAAGVGTWSGNYTATLFPGGTPETSQFSSQLTFIDANSFLATTTYTYAVGQNSVCTTVFQNTYIRTGK